MPPYDTVIEELVFPAVHLLHSIDNYTRQMETYAHLHGGCVSSSAQDVVIYAEEH